MKKKELRVHACPHPLGEDEVLGRLWDTQHSWPDIWRGRQPSTVACARANCLLRVVRPSAAVNFAETHDRAVWQCLANILRTDLSECSGAVQDAATLPFTLRGLGLRKATRVSGPAHWASWADCLPMIHARHPLVATVLLHQLEGAAVTPCLRGDCSRIGEGV